MLQQGPDPPVPVEFQAAARAVRLLEGAFQAIGRAVIWFVQEHFVDRLGTDISQRDGADFLCPWPGINILFGFTPA